MDEEAEEEQSLRSRLISTVAISFGLIQAALLWDEPGWRGWMAVIAIVLLILLALEQLRALWRWAAARGVEHR